MVKKEQKWFKNLKKNKSGMKKASNRIDYAKFEFAENTDLSKWLIGISLVIIFSLSVADVVKNPTEWIRVTGLVAYLVFFVMLFVSIIIQVIVVIRQKKAMKYLYQLKDKQERKQI